jgi:putative 4-mercaptohistidine N1-methyltranferase
MAYMDGRKKERALDIGCAVGRSTFELARGFNTVTGLDFSHGLIHVASEMQEQGMFQYTLPEEGELVSHHTKRLVNLGLTDTQNKVAFCQGDAQHLDRSLTDYDLIFAGNLIDRLPDPAEFLTHIHERLRIGGLLVITSPYTWLTDFTSRDKWVGGFMKNGHPYTTQDGMLALLSPRFNLIDDTRQVPFVIRETARKFQHTIAAMTVWERKDLHVN